METMNGDEAAAFLNISKASLYEKSRAKKIPGHKPGVRWVYIKEDLVSYIRSHYQPLSEELKNIINGESKLCQSKKEKMVKRTIQTSHITASELEDLLARPSEHTPKSSKTS